MLNKIDYQELISFAISNHANCLCKRKIADWLKNRRLYKAHYTVVTNVLKDLGYTFSIPMTWSKEADDDMRNMHGIDVADEMKDYLEEDIIIELDAAESVSKQSLG